MDRSPGQGEPPVAGNARRSRRRPDSIVKNTVSTFVAQMTTASLTAVMTLFLVRYLGVREYGIFALAVGMSIVANALADLGISDSTARFVAERRNEQDGSLAELVSDALKLKLVATGVLCALFAAGAPLIAELYRNQALVWPVRAIALATFGQSTYSMLTGVATALGRSAVNVRLVASESVIETVASIGLVLLGTGAAGAAFGRSIGFGLGALIAAIVVLRMSGGGLSGFWRRPRRATIGLIGGYAGPVFAIDASYTLSSTLCVLLVGAFLGSTAGGIFQAPSKVITMIQYVGLATAYGVAPRLSRGGGQKPNTAALNRAMRGLIDFQCLAIAPAVIWAKPITHLLLGPGYGHSAAVLAWISPYIFLSGLAPLVTISVSYVGEATKRVPVAIATLVLVAVCGVILIPREGVVGAAIATDIAFGFYTLAHIWLCRRLLELRISMLMWSLACAVTAAAAMGLVLDAVGTGAHLTIVSWAGGGAGGLAAYAAILLFTREISPADLATARRALMRRLGRGARQSPAAPPIPGAVYQIGWQPLGDQVGVFELRPIVGGPASRALAERSSPVPWRWRIGPAPTPDARDAQAELVARLLGSSWASAGSGEAWFEARFRPREIAVDDPMEVPSGGRRGADSR